MSRQISKQEIEKEIQEILSFGVVGYPSDFLSWLNMSFFQKYQEFELNLSKEEVQTILDAMVESGHATHGEFDKKEYTISQNSPLFKGKLSKEKYIVLGGHEYSPIQYLRSRLEYFLKINSTSETDIMDISIATIEAIENAVKYGDGNQIHVDYSIDSSKLFTIGITNRIKEFELQNEIERGKYSSNITLMRGVMVMQKLFDSIDLAILDETKQAKLVAQKKLS